MSVKLEQGEVEEKVKEEPREPRKRMPCSYEEPLSNIVEEITIDDESGAELEADDTEDTDHSPVRKLF